MRDTTFIYALCSPGTKEIRYFGKADDPQQRFRAHFAGDKRTEHLYCARWIAGLRKAGKRPGMHVLCEVPQDDFSRFEKAFIALGKQYDFPLTNLSDGGEGVSGIVPSSETRAKISAKAKGRAVSPETRAKIAAAHTGRKLSPEHCAKMSAAVTGRKDSPETRLKKSLVSKGKPKSLAHREKMSLVNRGKVIPPETRLKIKEATSGAGNHNFGKPLHPNTAAQLREKRPGAGSKFFGVSWCHATKKWKVQLSLGSGQDRFRLYLGCFADEIVAARTYDEAAKQHQIPAIKLNFPNG